MKPRFGPAGNPRGAQPLRSVLDAPAFVSGMGLDAYEYEGGHGIRISQQRAALLGEKAREHDVVLSVHSPYYISISSRDEEKRTASVDYILQSARAAMWMGAEHVVVHAGSCGGMPREQAMELAAETLRNALRAMDDEGLSGVRLCPETMGKLNQLGTLDEVMQLCLLDERLLPCIDFGHLNARTQGGLAKPDAVEKLFDTIENRLGRERVQSFHAHFSKIEYTESGEKRHLTFEDTVFGPAFEPVAEQTAKRGCHPVFICESAGTQAVDAKVMKEIYEKAAERLEGS